MDKKKIMIFPAGAENALEIYDALRYNVNVEVFGASGKKDFSEFIYDSEHYIESELYITKKGFDEIFEKIIKDYEIDVIIPTHDDVALYLAENRKKFSAKILVSDAKTAQICRRKRLMYELIKNTEFCPKVYVDIKKLSPKDFPIFIKPDISQGSVGAKIIYSYEQLNNIEDIDKYVITEYLSGTEYTVDCFTNRHGDLSFAGARSRDRIVMGIAFGSSAVEDIEKNEAMTHIAEVINQRLDFLGAWYFQLKEDKYGKLKLLEISCRQAGTMTLYRHMGVNFPMLGIFELFGVDTSFVLLNCSCQIERRISAAFKTSIDYQTVYMDYDDTLVVNGRVNGVVMQFLYQCVNDGKRIVLVTRHEGDLVSDMKNHRIGLDLFDEIVQMSFDEEKCDYISPDKAILIDNSFAERKKVSENYGIPVFDVDMVDMLIEQ